MIVYLIIIGIIAAIFCFVIYFARINDVKIFNFKEGKIEFWKPKNEKNIFIRPIFSIDPVISIDGRIYKIHLFVSILLTKGLGITNWTLLIKGLNSMVFKQYFWQDKYGNRIPLGRITDLPIKINENFVIGLEFEPEKDYKPIIFDKKVYKVKSMCDTSEVKQKIKFRFRVRERNLEALNQVAQEAIKDKQVKVISLPIIK